MRKKDKGKSTSDAVLQKLVSVLAGTSNITKSGVSSYRDYIFD